jgi:hypothetical protein
MRVQEKNMYGGAAQDCVAWLSAEVSVCFLTQMLFAHHIEQVPTGRVKTFRIQTNPTFVTETVAELMSISVPP